MDWQTAVVIVTIVVLLLGPGYWLWRDAVRHGRNPLIWVSLYAIAVVPPTRLRFILGPLVFAAWFLLRDRDFAKMRSARKAAAHLFRKLG